MQLQLGRAGRLEGILQPVVLAAPQRVHAHHPVQRLQAHSASDKTTAWRWLLLPSFSSWAPGRRTAAPQRPSDHMLTQCSACMQSHALSISADCRGEAICVEERRPASLENTSKHGLAVGLFLVY